MKIAIDSLEQVIDLSVNIYYNTSSNNRTLSYNTGQRS